MTAVQSFFAAACTDSTAVQVIDTLWLPRPLAPSVQSAQRPRSVLGEEPLDRLFCDATPHRFLRHGIIQLFLAGQASLIYSQAFRTMGHFLAC